MNVVLISRDHRLGAILTMALSAPEQLTVLESPAEVPESLETEIDAVVLDLPAGDRRPAYDELRQRYEGRVVVPVDNAKDTSGWPPDAKRRFLVRPFHVADLLAGVQEPASSVAERAAKYRRRFRLNRSHVPAFPSLTAAPAPADERPAAPPAAPEATAEPAALPAGPAEPTGPDATETSADTSEDATVELVVEEEAAVAAEAATEEGQAEDSMAQDAEAVEAEQPEAATEEAGEPVDEEAGPEAADEETAAEAADEEAADEEADAEATAEEAAPDATAEEAADEEAAAEATVEDGGEAGEEAQAAAEDDEALLAKLEEMVRADDEEDEGEDEEAGWADLEPGPRSVKDLRMLLSPEHPRAVPDKGPAPQAVPALPVQAGVAMAAAVALQQRLEAEELKRSRGRRRRIVANVAAGLVLLLAGVGVGRVSAPDQPKRTSPPAAQQPVVQFRNAPPPTACTAAMDNADQVISYLVAKIRDDRLSKAIQAYGANARACRTTGR